MKITIEQYHTKVTIEEPFESMRDLLSIYHRLSLAITYDQSTWEEAILDMADKYKSNEENK